MAGMLTDWPIVRAQTTTWWQRRAVLLAGVLVGVLCALGVWLSW